MAVKSVSGSRRAEAATGRDGRANEGMGGVQWRSAETSNAAQNPAEGDQYNDQSPPATNDSGYTATPSDQPPVVYDDGTSSDVGGGYSVGVPPVEEPLTYAEPDIAYEPARITTRITTADITATTGATTRGSTSTYIRATITIEITTIITTTETRHDHHDYGNGHWNNNGRYGNGGSRDVNGQADRQTGRANFQDPNFRQPMPGSISPANRQPGQRPIASKRSGLAGAAERSPSTAGRLPVRGSPESRRCQSPVGE